MKLKEWERLKRRILKHRDKCFGWNRGKPCFDCHYNTIGKIDERIDNIRK